MAKLTDAQRADYFHRCYKAVDGLWFVKTEEAYTFDRALDIDDAVWQVMPKIQARKLKELLGSGDGLGALFECFTTKLEIEGFRFAATRHEDESGFEVTLTHCPWHELLRKSNREQLSETIGRRICNSEYAGWAAEFGADLSFELGERICNGAERCVLRFARRDA